MTSEQQALALTLMPLVRSLAIDMLRGKPKSVLLEDLEGYGWVGLCEAAQRFDPSRGLRFTTFAVWRIRGAMLDGLRVMANHASETSFLEDMGSKTTFVENIGTPSGPFDPSDRRTSADESEDAIACRQALMRVGPATRAMVDRLMHAEHGYGVREAQRLGISKSWVSRLQQNAIEEVRVANAEAAEVLQ